MRLLTVRRRRNRLDIALAHEQVLAPVELDLETGLRQVEDAVAGTNGAHVGTHQRYFAPDASLRRGRRRGRDEQPGPRLAFAILGVLDDDPVAGEPDLFLGGPLSSCLRLVLRRRAHQPIVARDEPRTRPRISQTASHGTRRPRRAERAYLLVGCTPVNAGDLVDEAVKTLKASPAIDHWQRDRELIEAEDLLGHAIGTEDFDRDTAVSPGARRRFERMIERREKGEPVQLIKGYAIFRGLEILARPGVFVPRDSTEFLAEQAVRRVRRRRQPVLVDVATGGGGIALAVVNEVRRARVYGTDISPEAIRVARANARKLRLPATFVVGDLFGGLPKHLRGGVDVVTLHPPYVARSELRELPEEIRRWEPAHTLTDRSPDGLRIVERSTTEAPEWLRPGGWLLIEVSPDRARAVRSVMQRTGFRDVRSTMDREFKVTRVLVGRSP